jgi:cell division protein FtsL
MSIDLEYAIKKDIRNNPVVREADSHQAHELTRTVLVAVLVVGVLLFSVWQHFEMVSARRRIEDLRSMRAEAEVHNRQLRLQLETLRAPSQIERRAQALGLRAPTMDETLIVERVRQAAPPGSVVARAR